MIKKGDKVICIKEIDNSEFIYLTKHKIYTVNRVKYWQHENFNKYRIFIKDDIDAEWVFESADIDNLLYFKDYFMNLAEWRDKQIDSILED